MQKALYTLFIALCAYAHVSAATYNVLQRLSDLHDGDSVFVAAASQDFVMGTYVSGNNFPKVAATKDAEAHTLTADDANLYVVELHGDTIAFRAQNGQYVCNNSTSNKTKMQVADTKTTAAEWKLSIADEVATIRNIGNSYRPLMLYNKGANCFACYAAADNSFLPLALYSNHAPAYQTPELHPSMEVRYQSELLGDTLDWGEVVYDDSWGTEVAPYSQLLTISVTGTDLPEAIAIAVTGHGFSSVSTSLPAKGGTASINFEVTAPGTYLGQLTISCDTIVRSYVLKAKAVREATPDPSTQPTLWLEAESADIRFSVSESTSDLVGFRFAASNLGKKLYVKWNKNNQEPTIGYGLIEMLVGDWSLQAGEAAQFDAPTVDTTEVLISATTNGIAWSYSTTLSFYSYKADSKTELAIDVELPVSITITTTPTALAPAKQGETEVRKVLRDGQVLILRMGEIFSTNGQKR